MNTTDHRFLLNASYRGWKDSHDAYVELATQVAAGAEVARTDVDTARDDADRALSDFMSINQQAPQAPDLQGTSLRPAPVASEPLRIPSNVDSTTS